jgi:hypothetical protein
MKELSQGKRVCSLRKAEKEKNEGKVTSRRRVEELMPGLQPTLSTVWATNLGEIHESFCFAVYLF